MVEWFRFPYTRYNEINLDWILNQIKSLAADIPAVREAAQQATEAAEAATAAAEAAVEAVSTVTEQAAQAVATANAASQTATSASNTAETALSQAGQAQTAAGTAQTTADSALAQADLAREETAEINRNLTWNAAMPATGNTPVTIPATATEFCVMVKLSTNTSHNFSLHFVTAGLQANTTEYFRIAGYTSAQNYDNLALGVNKGTSVITITDASFVVNATDATADARTYVYYR